jgi:hypothetical protein
LPRIATLFQLCDDVIGDSVSFLFGQSFFEPAHDLAGASESEGNALSQHVSTGHVL